MTAARRGSRGASRSDAGTTWATGALSAFAAVLGVLSAMPIYRTPWVWAVAGAGWSLAFAVVWLGRRFRWGALTPAVLLLGCAIVIVPLAVPSALGSGPQALVRGLGDGLAAVALGWKQLLTLALPVGTYQAVLVPLFVVITGTTALIAWLGLSGGRAAPFAALPALVPVAFGVVFGASRVSAPLEWGPVSVPAPREIALWAAACAAGAVWVAWTSGAERRAALRLGRAAQPRTRAGGLRPGTATRGLSAIAIVVVALLVGGAVAPLVDGARRVPRDRIDPELVVREQTSPLAGYRSAKRDDRFGQPMFAVEAEGALPERLRLAVLDAYDGVDFFVSPGAAGRFTRFPSGEAIPAETELRVRIAEGYDGIWLPLAPPLAAPPQFSGARAGELADAFYVNREDWAAIAVPEGSGLRDGDAFAARMSAADAPDLAGPPASADPLVDPEALPQLMRWLDAQQLPAGAAGLLEAVERLRERGYLSHSLTDGAGEREWLDAVSEAYGTTFVPSPGGHSIARIEQLFTELNEQQAAAGDGADDRALVAAIGDDEQFAAAAALLARAMGFDSRVVLGVRLGDGARGVPGVPACSDVCTGEHLAAWIEVRGDEGAWAPIDVSPQLEHRPTALDRGEQLPEFPTVPEEVDASESDPPRGTGGESADETEEPERDGFAELWPILRAIGLSLLALLLLALPLLFLPVAKRIRRAGRRRAATPEERAVAAWQELVDGYADTGVEPAPSLGRREVAEQLGVPSGDWIAWTVDRAVYARESISEADAELVQELVDEALASRREAVGFWGRLGAAYSVRSLAPRPRRNRRRWRERNGR